MVFWSILACVKGPAAIPAAVDPDPCVAECARDRTTESVSAELIGIECRNECAVTGGSWQALAVRRPSPALAETARWYRQVLGFDVRVTESSPRIATLERSGLVVELVESDSPAPSGPLVLQVPNLDTLRIHIDQQQLAEAPVAIEHAGRRGIDLVAPDGGVVRLVSAR